MSYIKRKIHPQIEHALARGKSVLLLGPRQVGKTTLIKQAFSADIYLSLLEPELRIRYEKNPALFYEELKVQAQSYKKPLLVFVDEIQKIPALMDSIQLLIDGGDAQFILTGSSARKLKYGAEVNLLPGRVVVIHMDPFTWQECPAPKPSLEDLLIYGSLPNIATQTAKQDIEADLYAYTLTYLEEEIRAEALVRNIGGFARFLELSSAESGGIINLTSLSQEVGVAQSTIADYYQLLEDCLIAFRIDPITQSKTKRRLIKSPIYLFFDLGVRRAAANEGPKLSIKILSDLFEQFVGLELMRNIHIHAPHAKLRYWRDSSGPEVDFVLEQAGRYTPIEVKWSDQPSRKDARHLQKFLDEYDHAKQGYIICQTPRRYQVDDHIMALPWQELESIFNTPPGLLKA